MRAEVNNREGDHPIATPLWSVFPPFLEFVTFALASGFAVATSHANCSSGGVPRKSGFILETSYKGQQTMGRVVTQTLVC